MKPSICLAIVLASSASCASAPSPTAVDRPFEATIHRDAFGVAHVHGATDADAAYGLAYAQAEDNLWQVEENFVRATGRAAELHGEALVLDDWINRSLGVERLARAEFDASDPRLRRLLVGFAAGFNDYVRDHPDAELRLLERFEPWHPLTLIRYLYFQRGFLGSLRLPRAAYADAFRRITGSDMQVALEGTAVPRDEVGSNSWAVSPERSASGAALLFINPHLPFFGPSQVYEGHVLSDEGWNFTGYGRFGFPLPYVGFNEELGWASTDNAADLADAYVETLTDDGRRYEYGDDERELQTWSETVRVRRGDELIELELPMQRTHHGPLVATSGDRLVAAKLAKLEEPGWLAQWYAMTRARTLDEFRRAVEPLDMLFGNYLYADRGGNIFYVYNACVPKRDEAFDWSRPVEGRDPRTEWRGFHSMDELPQALNPASGYLQNCNSTPFLTTSTGNPARADYPSYMAPEPDSARARNARRILESRETFDFDTWTRLSYDTTLVTANDDLPLLFAEYDELRASDASSADELARAIELLRAWDRVATVESTATTLYVLFGERVRGEVSGDWPLTGALREACDELGFAWNSIEVPWGELNRHQRAHSSGADGGRDDSPSLAVAGGPSWSGPMFTFWAGREQDQKRRYGVGGNSYVAVVEFGERVRGLSLHPFGSATSPDTPGRGDLQARYLSGDYKPAWLTLDEVRANALTSQTVRGDPVAQSASAPSERAPFEAPLVATLLDDAQEALRGIRITLPFAGAADSVFPGDLFDGATADIALSHGDDGRVTVFRGRTPNGEWRYGHDSDRDGAFDDEQSALAENGTFAFEARYLLAPEDWRTARIEIDLHPGGKADYQVRELWRTRPTYAGEAVSIGAFRASPDSAILFVDSSDDGVFDTFLPPGQALSIGGAFWSVETRFDTASLVLTPSDRAPIDVGFPAPAIGSDRPWDGAEATIVSFCSSGCYGCTVLAPHLDSVAARFAEDDGVRLWNVARDAADSARMAAGLARPCEALVEPEAWTAFGVTPTPTIFVIDADGTIRLRLIGTSKTTGEQLIAAVLETIDPGSIVSSEARQARP